MIIGNKTAVGLVIGSGTVAQPVVAEQPTQSEEEPHKVVDEAEAAAMAAGLEDRSPTGNEILESHKQRSIFSKDFSAAQARVWGLYFGYPDCCIDFYCLSAENGSHLQSNDATGYCPCPECAKKLITGKMEKKDLLINRICAAPFPYSVMLDDMKVVEQGRPSATMMRILRLHLKAGPSASSEMQQYELSERMRIEEKLADAVRRMPRKAREVAQDYLQALKD